jgi:cytochrome c oxidase subunit 1
MQTTPGAFLSSHPRDIGYLYLILAAFSGGLGHGFSHPIRMGVARAGPQLLVGSDPPYPVILTAHAILMIFFMAMAALLGGFGNWFVPPLIL